MTVPASHINVQPPEYWAQLFARQGFFRDVDFDIERNDIRTHAVELQKELATYKAPLTQRAGRAVRWLGGRVLRAFGLR